VTVEVAEDRDSVPLCVDVMVLWGAAAAPGKDWQVELALLDPAGEVRQSATYPVVAAWPTSEWPANAVGRGCYALQVDGQLRAGSYDLTLALADPETGQQVAGSATTVVVVDVP